MKTSLTASGESTTAAGVTRRRDRCRAALAVIYFSLLTVSCKTGQVQHDPTPSPAVARDVSAAPLDAGEPAAPVLRPAGAPPAGDARRNVDSPRAAAPPEPVSPSAPPQEGSPAAVAPQPDPPRTAFASVVPDPSDRTQRGPSPERESGPSADRASTGTPVRTSSPPPKPPPVLHVTDRDPIHDPSNPAYDRLQKPSEALRGLPLDRMGRVNWVQALGDGLVAPRASVDGSARMEVLQRDIIMTDTRSMPHVRFPHAAHTEWLSCDNCHPQPFVAGDNANRITMDDIFRGRYCGVCHDKVAFSTFVCERCHSVPHAGSPAKWW